MDNPIVFYKPNEGRAAIFVAIEFLEEMFSIGFSGFKPLHGLRNVSIKQFSFVPQKRCFVFYIDSPDIDAYVGYHKAMEDLDYFNGVPLIGTVFVTDDIKRVE